MNLRNPTGADLPVAKMVIRGKIYEDHLVEVGGRGGDLHFRTPDANMYLDRLPLGNPGRLADLYDISFEDILDYLQQLGERLDPERNPILRRARELSYLTAPTTRPIVDASYAMIPSLFGREAAREVAEKQIGVRYLEGWVEEDCLGGMRAEKRCFGARTLHIVAGNSPPISAMTIVRNAILRSDAIIKAPSNDPFTALAIAETMAEMAPDHPITKHLSVAYWRGGDTALEEKLYQPHNIEKIVAWGGFASVKHVTRYIQPGLELVSLDPKLSTSIVGAQAFESPPVMREVARRIAADVGGMNQVACVNARVIYVVSGTDDEGVAKLGTLGRLVYEEMQRLPESTSTKPKHYDRDLKTHVDAARFNDDWYEVIGGEDDEGAIIVSKVPEPVDFAPQLGDRTANLVPVDALEDIFPTVNSYTQTIGVFPESLKQQLVDKLSLFGAQRFVSLGYAVGGSPALPQDGIEPLRRMGKWVVNEISDPVRVAPPWLAPV